MKAPFDEAIKYDTSQALSAPVSESLDLIQGQCGSRQTLPLFVITIICRASCSSANVDSVRSSSKLSTVDVVPLIGDVLGWNSL